MATFAKNIKKKETMATITLEYDAQNSILTQLLDICVSLGAKIKKPRKKMSGIEEALEDERCGRIYSAKNVDDMLQQILG